MKRVYVGPKQLTIENNDFFDYSITLFGDKGPKNISYKKNTLDNVLEFEYWNPDSNSREISIYNELLQTIEEPFEIMAHDNKILTQCNIPSNAKLICKNSDELIFMLNDKIKTRNLFSGIVPMLEYKIIKGSDVDYHNLNSNAKMIVVQHPCGSGGSKTFLFTEENNEKLKENIIDNDEYIISDYVEKNIPYNIHCIISENQIEIFPPSMQDLEIDEKIEYVDSNYNIELTEDIREKFYDYTNRICSKLQKIGYRGVLGIDYIYANNELYFIEINPRFQGSTRKLDKILKENNLPSIFEYNLQAFENKCMKSTKKLKNSIFDKRSDNNE